MFNLLDKVKFRFPHLSEVNDRFTILWLDEKDLLVKYISGNDTETKILLPREEFILVDDEEEES